MKRPKPAKELKTPVFIPRPLLSHGEIGVVEQVSCKIVMHDGVQKAKALIDQLLDENVALSEPRHCLLIGASGCGKTTLTEIYRSKQPPEDETFQLGNRFNRPLLLCSLPSTITPKSMACHMLRALGDKSNLHGTCFELTERLKRLIKECKVRMIFIDEVQHLIALGRGTERGATRRLTEARNWIKSVINGTHVSFVLMGMPESLALVDSDDQLSRRFTHLYELEPFDIPSTDNWEMAAFADDLMLHAVEALPHFDSAELFAEQPLRAMQLFTATAGVPSAIKDLVTEAVLIAYRRKSRHIEMIDFETAFSNTTEARLLLEEARARREKRRSLVEALEGRVLNPFLVGKELDIHQLMMKMAA